MGIMKMHVCMCGAEFSTQQAMGTHQVNDCSLRRKKTSHDPVKPDHYSQGGIQPWDYMKTKMTPEMFEGFLIGNVIKYVSRYSHKNGLEDLKKARQYLDKAIEQYNAFTIEN